MTWLKAKVGDTADEYVEYIQAKLDMNKSEATAYIIEEQAEQWDEHDAIEVDND